MSLLSTIKKILPGSSRSLHAMHEDMDRRFDEVFARIEQADNGINMNINYKFDTRLTPVILDGLTCLWTSAGMIILQRMFCLILMFAPRWQSLSSNVISSYNGFD